MAKTIEKMSTPTNSRIHHRIATTDSMTSRILTLNFTATPSSDERRELKSHLSFLERDCVKSWSVTGSAGGSEPPGL